MGKRNELESYIYSMRDKLVGVYKNFASDEEKTTMNSQLLDSEDWLYGDGFDSVKSEYKKKLDDLKVIGDKVEFRFFESENRSSAVDGLKKQIELCRSFAANREESHSHITDDERDRVIVEVKGAEDWLYELLSKQADLPECADPALTCAMIHEKCKSVFNVTNPIMIKKKPKPEPKPVPPEETKVEGKEGEQGKEGGEGKEGKEGGDEEGSPMEDGATAAAEDGKSGEEPMEL